MLESKQPHSNSYDTILTIVLNKSFYESKWGLQFHSEPAPRVALGVPNYSWLSIGFDL